MKKLRAEAEGAPWEGFDPPQPPRNLREAFDCLRRSESELAGNQWFGINADRPGEKHFSHLPIGMQTFLGQLMKACKTHGIPLFLARETEHGIVMRHRDIPTAMLTDLEMQVLDNIAEQIIEDCGLRIEMIAPLHWEVMTPDDGWF